MSLRSNDEKEDVIMTKQLTALGIMLSSNGHERITDLKSALTEWIQKANNQRGLITKPEYSIERAASTSEKLSLHHMISHSHLVDFVKLSLGHDKVECFMLLLRILKDYVAYDRQHRMVLGGSPETLDLFEQFIDPRSNEINDPRSIIKIKEGQSVREAIKINFSQLFQKMLRLFVWPPYNLIEGPQCRTRDRASAFDSEIAMLLEAPAYFQMIDFRRTLWTINNLPDRRTAELYDHLYELHRGMLNARPLPRAYDADEWMVNADTPYERQVDRLFAEYEAEHELGNDLDYDVDVTQHLDERTRRIDDYKQKGYEQLDKIAESQDSRKSKFIEGEVKLFRVHLTRRDFSYEDLLEIHFSLSMLKCERSNTFEYLLDYLRKRTPNHDVLWLERVVQEKVRERILGRFVELYNFTPEMPFNDNIEQDFQSSGSERNFEQFVNYLYNQDREFFDNMIDMSALEIACRELYSLDPTGDEELRIHQKNFLHPSRTSISSTDSSALTLGKKRVKLTVLSTNWVKLVNEVARFIRLELHEDLKKLAGRLVGDNDIDDARKISLVNKRVIDALNLYRIDHLSSFFATF